MEGSESESIFESMDLNPRSFINEVLNSVDDLVDDAFNYFQQQASSTLKTEATNKFQDLTQGMTMLQNKIHFILDKRLSAWEEQCLNHCFEVPQGFSLPKTDQPSENIQAFQDTTSDQELDAELDFLRSKLNTVNKDSAAINQELRAIEKQSATNDHFTALITEAMQSYNQNSYDHMFKEMATTVSELRTRMGKMKSKRLQSTVRARTERFHTLTGDSSALDPKNGFADANLDDLQMFMAEIKKM